MDTALVFGITEPRLPRMLAKLGIRLIEPDAAKLSFAELANQEVIDVIVFEEREAGEFKPMHEVIRAQASLRAVPILCLSAREQDFAPFQDKLLDGIVRTSSPGAVIARVVTALRLRKIAGDDPNASLAEMNAALRSHNQRYTSEMEEARRIQQALLPSKLPSTDAFEVTALFEPLEEVGGDWYFVNESSDKKFINILLADVTGHGLSAAFLGTLTRLAMQAAGEGQPHETLGRINDLLCPLLPEGRFITMISGRYELATSRLEISSAGHPPPLLVSSNPEIEPRELAVKGFAIGFVEGAQFKSIDVTLNSKDLVVFYTDGFTEARNRSNAFFGSEGIARGVKAAISQPLNEVTKSLRREIEQFCEGRLLKDDLSAIILRKL